MTRQQITSIFGILLFLAATSYCPDTCIDEIFSGVCGTDGLSYTSRCSVLKKACELDNDLLDVADNDDCFDGRRIDVEWRWIIHFEIIKLHINLQFVMQIKMQIFLYTFTASTVERL